MLISCLSDKQKDFLLKEFGLSVKELSELTKEDWLIYREKRFDIEVEESVKAAKSDDDYIMPERERIAVGLLETPLSQLGFDS